MPRINQSIESKELNEKGEIVSKKANRVLSWGDEPAYIKLIVLNLTEIPLPVGDDFPENLIIIMERESKMPDLPFLF